MKKRFALMVRLGLVAVLLVGVLSGCNTEGDGKTHSVREAVLKADYMRQYVGLTDADDGLLATNLPAFLANGNEVCYARNALLKSDEQQYIFYRCDIESGEETVLHRASYTYGETPYACTLSPSHNVLWLYEYCEGDMIYGGTQSDRYLLKAINVSTGETTDEKDLTNLLGITPGQTEMQLCTVGDEQVYGFCPYTSNEDSGWMLFLYDGATGKLVAEQTFADLVNPELVTLSDGRMAIATTNGVTPIKAGGCEAEKTIAVAEVSLEYVFRGGDDYLFLYAQDGTLYGYRADNEKTETVLSFAENGVIFDEQQLKDARLADDVVTCIVSNESNYDIYTLTPCEGEDAPRVLTVAGYIIPDQVEKVAIEFNQTHTDYTARLVDYAQYDDSTSSSNSDTYEVPAGLLRLNTELLAGKEIDLLCMDHVSTAALIRQDALLDLYTLMDEDETMSRDAFVAQALEAMETDEHLYQLSTGFTLRTMIANTDLVGEIDRMDLATWETLAVANSDVPVIKKSFMRDRFMYFYIQTVFSDYIDKNRKSCHFDDGAFAKYLEKSKTFATEDDVLQMMSNSILETDTNASVSEGKCLFAERDIHNFMHYQRMISELDGKIAFVGYPTEKGAGHMISFENGLAIVQNTPLSDAAWEFIKLSVAQNRQYDGEYSLVFPTDRQAFETQLAYYQDEANFVYEDGAAVTTFEGNPALALTDGDAERLYALIEAAKPVIETDVQIRAIISAEASYYYAAACTAEQAAQNIQNRVSLYLREQG